MSKTEILRAVDYLEHILEAIRRINRYTDDMVEHVFLENQLVQDAVIRNLENIGEAAHNIERYHVDFAATHSEVPWSDIYLMRNRVSHGYFTVDLEIVWKTIEKDLPELQQQIQKIYDKVK
jgi:uncharacterized protein with HEPN domain